jgi:two-component system nitrogen regulation response regulator NtrX
MAAILVVDDEPNIRRMVCSVLAAEGHDAVAAASGEEALAKIEVAEPDVVLLDLALPGANGVEILRRLRHARPNLPVVMMSGRATLADAVQATKLGAFHFIEKPLAPEAVLLTIASAVELRRARELSRTLLAELGAGERLVGSSATMARVRELIEQIAPTDARVLVTGESGTGKELVASALHELSGRAGGPFVRVNSAAIPRELIESEMFGHERGAFTGATDRRLGRFELADRGTLFLDEVADLGPEAQAKLLRALETGEIERVGGQRNVRVDVRVIAATNRDLDAERAAGRFRDDLYYRLNVLRLHLPPLRDRLEDVPELAAHFLERFRQRHGRNAELAPEAIARMQQYRWPGNVRELANVCERVAILFAGQRVGSRELSLMLAAEGASPVLDAELSLAEQLDQLETRLIQDSLAATGGSIADAARRLRTDRPNLYRRMRRLGIDR